MTGPSSETPVLDTLAAINAESIARSGLDPTTLLAVRIAALAAVDAPVASYLMHVGPAMDTGLTVETIQNILIGVAPVIGTPRTLAAALNITEAVGITVVALEEGLEAEQEGQ